MTAPRAKEIFLDALERPGAERRAFVDAACAGDDALRAAVERLLSAHGAADKVFLDAPTVEVGRLKEERSLGEEPIPERVGPYAVRGRLGEGGFAVVYRAEQERPVRREVALKVLKAGMDSVAVIRRFEAERQTLARMNHPGIARVFDAGATESGRPYFAMELVEGPPITAYSDLHRLTVRERLRLFHRVCLAVQHAHQKGVIHRDIKPANVLIVGVDGGPEPRVIDFGIAKALTPGEGDGASMTVTGQLIGTPLYMAPEQASGGAIDTRTDVYALGILLYELLAGSTPFDATRLESQPLLEVFRVIQQEEAPRASSRISSMGEGADAVAAARRTDANRLWRELRGDLDNLVARAIEKDPARRYPGVTALADDVRRYLDGMPLEAGPPTVRYRASKALRRHWVAFAATGVVMLAVMALAGGAVMFGLRQREYAQRLELQRVRSDTAADFARGILSGVDPARARGADTALLREILAEASERVETELREAHPEAAFDMRTTLGVAYSRIGDLQEAERIFRVAADEATRWFGAADVRTLEVINRRATALSEMGRNDEAVALLIPVVQEHRRARGIDHPDTQAAVLNLGAITGRAGRLDEAKSTLEELYGARLRTLGPEHEGTLTAANNLAVVLSELKEHDRASALLREVLDAQEGSLGVEHPRALMTAHNLAASLGEAEREEEAMALLEPTVERKRRVLGEGHPSTMASVSALATLYSLHGRVPEAEALFRRAIEVGETSLTPDSPRQVGLLNGLGGLLLRNGRAEEAEPIVARAAEAMAKVAGEDHPHALVLRSNHAMVLLRLERFEETRESAARWREVALRRLGPAHSVTVDLTRSLAFATEGLGDRDGALAILTDAHEACRDLDAAQAARLDEAMSRVRGAEAAPTATATQPAK